MVMHYDRWAVRLLSMRVAFEEKVIYVNAPYQFDPRTWLESRQNSFSFSST